MTDEVKHKCGIALVRLLKPLEYYRLEYGSWRYGLEKLYLLMEKQRNRGQDGAGLVSLKLDTQPGSKYFNRKRRAGSSAINEIFQGISQRYAEAERKKPGAVEDPAWAKAHLPFAAEAYLGHLRYGTFGANNTDNLHPVMRQNNWRTRNLVMAGNFNLTNVDELFRLLVELGQFPKEYSDTVTMLEKIGHFLDRENQLLFDSFKARGYSNVDISDMIAKHIDVPGILKQASKAWDGGYTVAGMLGHGDVFAMRDPWGIRPAYYYHDDEIVIVASERPVIQTAMDLTFDDIRELPPGHALVVKKDGDISLSRVGEEQERRSCSFERIYFSRGSDREIYQERKKLGELLVPDILEAIDYDVDNTVFSYIPNTAESAFYGMVKGVEDYTFRSKLDQLMKLKGSYDLEDVHRIVSQRARIEKVAIKDLKLRTFISQDKGRKDMVSHVYDVTYGTIRRGIDNLVIIDDSIVRGTTLKQSIIKILDRLDPKLIVVVSSSPQIRFPDCYGIDMARLGDFVAFQAAIELLRENNMAHVINEVFKKCDGQKDLPKEEFVNYVTDIYKPFSDKQISEKIAELLTDSGTGAELKIVYQSIENLHKAVPNDRGDWYFTGDYPTPGGNKVASTSFLNYIHGINSRAY
ncbi:MAG: amidophosphoribosyltransferase [Bacteroidetes bacterium]|nr:MAG: amidophosphoribosyltransferase [Bacteroidota bacterium]